MYTRVLSITSDIEICPQGRLEHLVKTSEDKFLPSQVVKEENLSSFHDIGKTSQNGSICNHDIYATHQL